MTTRAYVPNADGEGSVGVEDLKWGAMYVKSPAEDDNSQKVPSTAWVQNLISAVNTEISSLQSQMATMQTETTQAIADAGVETLKKIFPVGSVYTSLTDSRNPSQILGFGTWEALPAGYTLIAQGSGTDDFGSFNYVAGTKYGERMHKLTTDEMPKIKGSVSSLLRWNTGKVQSGVLKAVEGTSKFPSSSTENVSNTTVSIEFGKDVAHENLPPMVAAYGWKRVA